MSREPRTRHVINFSALDSTAFESLTYDLLRAEGFQNLDWRDGGADGGRDISAVTFEKDTSGFEQQCTWYCDAKLYSRGIGFEKIQPTLARAVANSPDYLLFSVYPHLSPQCKDELRAFCENERPRFRVRLWEKKDLEQRLLENPGILREHLPDSWSETVEVGAYLAEAARALRSFRSRVPYLWHTAEGRPVMEFINVKVLDHNVPYLPSIDLSHQLSKKEKEFLHSLVSAALHMQGLMAHIFNLEDGVLALPFTCWKDHPNDCIVIPVAQRDILTDDLRYHLSGLLGYVERDYHKITDLGIVACGGYKPPFNGPLTHRFYLIPDSAESEPE